MGYEVQSQNCQPGQSVQFTFQHPIQSYVVGLGQFFLTYGATSYWIETLSIGLQTSQPSHNVVEVTPAVTMADHTGHSIDAAGSSLWVVCVAMTGTSDQNTILTNVPGVTPAKSQPVTLPGSGGAFSVLEVFLSGLDLSYETADHRYQGATAIPGIEPQGTEGSGSVTAQVDLWDDSGHHAVTASIGAGVLASVDADGPGFMVGSLTRQAGTPITVSYQFPSSVGGAVALIQSFTLQYASGNYSVQALLVGALNLRINGDTVLIDAYVYTTDGEHSTDDAPQSSVKLLVVAIPAA